MSERIVYPKRESITISDGGDVTAHVTGPEVRNARRFALDVAEDALQRMGPETIQYVTQKLAERIAYEQRGAVEATVNEYLRNQAWAEPIIRQAIKDAVREHLREMFEVMRGLS